MKITKENKEIITNSLCSFLTKTYKYSNAYIECKMSTNDMDFNIINIEIERKSNVEIINIKLDIYKRDYTLISYQHLTKDFEGFYDKCDIQYIDTELLKHLDYLLNSGALDND